MFLDDIEIYFRQMGFLNLEWGHILLMAVGLGFIILAVVKNMEPYELLPIGLGMVVANLPLTNIAFYDDLGGVQTSGILELYSISGLKSGIYCRRLYSWA